MDNNDSRKWLYESLKGKGYDLGSYDEFDSHADEADTRKWLYETARESGFDMGSYEDFDKGIGYRAPRQEETISVNPQTIADTFSATKSEYPSLKEMADVSRFAPVDFSQKAGVDAMSPYSVESLGSRLQQLKKDGKLDMIIHQKEERELDRIYSPKKVENETDALENYRGRFGLTERGKFLNEELDGIRKEITDRYTNEYLASDRYKQLSSRYSGKQLNEEIDKDFQQQYGDRISKDMAPYMDAYNQQVFNRYDVGIQDDLTTLAKGRTINQVADLRRDIEQELGKTQPEINAPAGSAFIPSSAYGAAQRYGNVQSKEQQDRYTSLVAAKNLLDEADDIVNEASKKGNTTFLGGFSRGVRDKGFDVDTWAMGITDTAYGSLLRKAAQKSDRGEELSSEEKKLLEAAAVNMATQAYFASDLGRGYKAGGTSAQSIPFMLEFALNPVSGSGNAIAKGILKYGAKRFGLKALESSAVKNGLKVGSRLAGDAIAAAGMTATSGLGHVASGAQERMLGDAQFDFNEDGKIRYTGRENQMSDGDAWLRSTLSNTLENQSEMVFNAFKGAGGVVGVPSTGSLFPGIERFSASKAGELYRAIKNNPTYRKLAERTQFHGMPEEYFEEVYNNLVSLPLGEGSWEESTDIDNNIDTFLGVAPTSIVMSMLGLGSVAKESYSTRRNRDRFEKTLSQDELSFFKDLKQKIKDGNIEDAREVVKLTLNDKKLTSEQKKEKIRYVYDMLQENTIEAVRNAETEDAIQKETDDIVNSSNQADGTVTECNRITTNEIGETVLVPGHIVGWMGGTVVENPDGTKSREGGQPIWQPIGSEERITLHEGEFDPESVKSMPTKDMMDATAEMMREEAQKKAEMESKYDLNRIDPPHGGATFTDMSGRQITLVDKNPNGGWIAKTPVLDDKGNPKKDKAGNLLEENLTITNEDYYDTMQAQLDAQEKETALQQKYGTKVLDDGRTAVITSEKNGEISYDVIGFRSNLEDSGNMSLQEYESLRDYVPVQEEELDDDGLPVNSRQEENSSNLSENQAENETLSPAGENIVTPNEVPAAIGEANPAPEPIQEQKPALPVDEKGNILYHKMPVENTIADLTDGTLDDNEIDSFIAANKAEAGKLLKKVNGSAPKISTNKAKYLADKKAWQEKVADAQARVDYWNSIGEEIAASRVQPGDKTAEAILSMGEPMNGEELAAMMLGTGRLPILYDSYKKETGGRNTEARGMVGLFATKAKGGLSIEEAGELLMLADQENGTHFFDENDPNAGRNTIIDVLSGARTRGDLFGFIQRNREVLAERERQAELEAYEQTIARLAEASHMTPEEFIAFEENIAQMLEERLKDIPDEELKSIFAELYLDENYGRSRESDEVGTGVPEGEERAGSNEGSPGVLSEERGDNAGASEQSEERPELDDEIGQSGDGILLEADAVDGREEIKFTPPTQIGGENLLDYAARVVESKRVHDAGSEVDTNPTEAQKEAGNYKKGHVKIDGFDITIENPKGSVRSGVDADGKPWSVTMNNTYGYIRGTEGVDGDHIDVFLGDSGNKVYVVDQLNTETGAFDEHKVMYGFNSTEEATEAYLSNYSPGWQGLGAISEVSKESFKKWIDSSHRKTKPFVDYKSVKVENGGETVVNLPESNPIASSKKSELGIEIPAMTEEEYIASEGYSFSGIGDVALHKGKQRTSKQQDKIVESQAKKDEDYARHREILRKTYRDKLSKGELREPNIIEKLLKTANGNPDNESTQAARRTLQKRGIDWQETSIRFRETVSLEGQDVIEETNERFNEELKNFTEENADKVYFNLGMPSAVLVAGGVENKPIKLYGSKLLAKVKKHGFTISELHNLPLSVASPIAVFNNIDRKGNRSVLTELKTENGNFLVTIDLGKGEDADFDIVSSVFGKNDSSVVNWINKGYATYIDKEKALNYLHLSAPIAEASNSSELSSATKIVESFENPTIEQGKIVSEVESLADSLHTPVRAVKSVEELPEEDVARKRIENGDGIKGWFDIKSEEMAIYLPNATSMEDARESVFHEVVGHYGLRKLFGEDFNTFLDNVYANVSPEIRKQIVNRAKEQGNILDLREATEEYLAALAERGFDSVEERTLWQKIKDAFIDMLRKAGVHLGFDLTDNELRYVLWKSYQNLESESIMDRAADIDMQRRLKVGNFRENEAEREQSEESYERALHTVNEFVEKHVGAGSVFVVRSKEKLREQLEEIKIAPEDIDKYERWMEEGNTPAFFSPKYGRIIVLDSSLPKEELNAYLWHESTHKALNDLYEFNEYELRLNSLYEALEVDYRDYFESIRELYSEESELGKKNECVTNFFEHLYKMGGDRLVNGLNRMQSIGIDKEGTLLEVYNYIYYGKRQRNDGQGVRTVYESDQKVNKESLSSKEVWDYERNGRFGEGGGSGRNELRRLHRDETEGVSERRFRTGESTGEDENTVRTYEKEIRELNNRISSLERAIERYENGENVSKAVVDEIRRQISSDFVNEINKSELTSLLAQVQKAKTKKSLEKIFMNVKRVALDAHSRKLQRVIDKLLALKVQDVNGKNMSIAKNVDDSTRKIFTFIRGNLSDLKISGLEDEILFLKRENRKRQEEVKRLERVARDSSDVQERESSRTSIEELKKVIEESKKSIKELRDEANEIKESVANFKDIDIEKELGLLNDKIERAARNEDTWTQNDNERMAALNIISATITNKKHDYEIRDIELRIQKMVLNNSDLYRERGGLKDEVKRKRINEKIKENHRQIGAMERLINDTRSMQVQQMQMTIDQLNELISNGKNSLLRKTEDEMKRKRMLIGNAIRSVEGKPINIEDKELNKERTLKKFFSAPMGSFNYMCQRVNTKTFGKDGFLYKRFVEGNEGTMRAHDTYILRMKEVWSRLDEKTRELFGKSFEKITSFSDKVVNESGVHVFDPTSGDGYGVRYEKPLSKGQAMYIYQVWKMADGRTKLELQGFDEESIAEIVDFIGPEYVKFADWVQEEFLPELRERYNERYLEMYNTSLAKIENYIPLKINKNAIREESSLSDDGKKRKTLEEKAGSLINRVVNTHPVDMVNGFNMLLEHTNQMEEWNAYARVRRDLDYILSSTIFRNQLNANVRGSYKNFYDAAEVATKVHNVEILNGVDIGLGVLSKAIVGGNIAFRLYTAVKQFLSAPAFLGYSQSRKFMVCVAKSIVTPKTGFKWCMENMPSFYERVTSGLSGSNDLEKKYGKSWFEKGLDKYIETGMIPNKFIDALTCSIGIKAIYDYRYLQLKESGIGEVEARNQAMAEADVYYNETQQSSHPAFLSPMQMSRTFSNRMIAAYQNSNLGYVRKLFLHFYDLTRSIKWKELKKNYTEMYIKEGMNEEDAESKAYRKLLNENRKHVVGILLYGWGMNTLWNIGSQGLLGAFRGDGDDDDDKWEKGLSFMVTSPIKGTLLGNFAEGFVGGYGYNPFMLFEEANKAVKEIGASAEECGLSPQLAYVALQKASRIAGFDLEVWGNIYLGLEGMARDGVFNDDGLMNTMFILNAPKSNRAAVAKELYKDEPLLDFAEKVARANKYIPKRDSWENWVPGSRNLTKRKENEIKKEYERLHMTDKQKKEADERKIADKHKRKLKELEDDILSLAEYIDGHKEEHQIYKKYY